MWHGLGPVASYSQVGGKRYTHQLENSKWKNQGNLILLLDLSKYISDGKKAIKK